MKRILALLAAGAALGVLLDRLLGRRARGGLQPGAEPEEDDPRAEALRAKLEAGRTGSSPAPPFDRETETAAGAGQGAEDAAGARRRVHERGREALDEMRRSGTQREH